MNNTHFICFTTSNPLISIYNTTLSLPFLTTTLNFNCTIVCTKVNYSMQNIQSIWLVGLMEKLTEMCFNFDRMYYSIYLWDTFWDAILVLALVNPLRLLLYFWLSSEWVGNRPLRKMRHIFSLSAKCVCEWNGFPLPDWRLFLKYGGFFVVWWTSGRCCLVEHKGWGVRTITFVKQKCYTWSYICKA